MATWTTSDFLDAVRRRGSIPTTTNSNNVNSTANLLNLATEELLSSLVPMIMTAREEFYVAIKDHTITASQADYLIPPRAIGLTLRDVQIVEGNGVRSLPRVDPELINSTSTGTPQGYYLRHNKVMLYPTPGATTGTLRLSYYLRPGRLVATSSAAQITAVNSSTGLITFSATPSTFSTSTALDIICPDSPYHYRAIDSTPTATSATTITLSSVPSDVAVGDWVALADYSPIPQVPFEFQSLLIQQTVAKALEALGDGAGAASARKDMERLQAAAMAMITPRNHGEAKKIVQQRWWR